MSYRGFWGDHEVAARRGAMGAYLGNGASRSLVPGRVKSSTDAVS